MTAPIDTLGAKAAELLGEEVRFIRSDDGVPIRGVIYGRWLSRFEWARLRREGLAIATRMTPAPARRRSEAACPCPECGFCVCKWVGDGKKRCACAPCICPRLRAPVRLALHHFGRWRTVLELRRGKVVLAELGEWTEEGGWDFTSAGDAKTQSLAKVISAVGGRDCAQQPSTPEQRN